MTADVAAYGRAGTSASNQRRDWAKRGCASTACWRCHLPALSRTRLKRLIEEGHVIHAGPHRATHRLRVRPGQNFVVFFPEC